MSFSCCCFLFLAFSWCDSRAQKTPNQATTAADRVSELDRKIQDLELTCKVMSGDINQLKFDRMVDTDSIQGFQGSVDDVHHDLDGDVMNVTKLRSDVDELSKRVSSLEDKLRNDSESSSPTRGATR